MCRSAPPQERRVRHLLTWATDLLRDCLRGAPDGSADTPYLDALLLLSHATGEPVERLMASLRDEIPEDDVPRFASFVEQRCSGMPVSYIRGFKEFYGREFIVSPAVLVPRPDTEVLVETALEVIDTLDGPSLHLHDACTGSGCVALTVGAERPAVTVTASDISPDALDVARRNADRIVGPARVPLWRSDLLEQLPLRLDERGLPSPRIITANPPYLTDNEYQTMRDCGWPEPEQALRGGEDGLDLVRKLAKQAVTALRSGAYLMVEIGPRQGSACTRILADHGFSNVRVRQDLAGRDRVVVGHRPD